MQSKTQSSEHTCTYDTIILASFELALYGPYSLVYFTLSFSGVTFLTHFKVIPAVRPTMHAQETVKGYLLRQIEFYSDCSWHRSSFTSVHTSCSPDRITHRISWLLLKGYSNLSTTDNNIKCQNIQISITYIKISNINHIEYQMQKSNIKYKKIKQQKLNIKY